MMIDHAIRAVYMHSLSARGGNFNFCLFTFSATRTIGNSNMSVNATTVLPPSDGIVLFINFNVSNDFTRQKVLSSVTALGGGGRFVQITSPPALVYEPMFPIYSSDAGQFYSLKGNCWSLMN